MAILGLLPASLATGLGSDVQRPLATVIVWGLFSSTVLTLLVVPVAYSIFPPFLRDVVRPGRADEAGFIEPLPDVTAMEIVSLLDYLLHHDGEARIARIAEELHREFARTVSIVKAAEMLGLVETPQESAALTATGKRLVKVASNDRQALWRERLLTLGLFRTIHSVMRHRESRVLDSEFVLETIVTRMPYENHDRVFNTFVDWSRYGELFGYDEVAHEITLLR